ncbi:hypothetical protein LTR37_017541 [Vermiconidia calcicola]|uniref:Uncharacterized protein n=1 Tax=Vermiconidia calcicola TaxID=1690605 RepID=A0ACC3MJL3_9PEZI|nr:hypothetical protein LTR37_017541 [Vermiconidia calcicola]
MPKRTASTVNTLEVNNSLQKHAKTPSETERHTVTFTNLPIEVRNIIYHGVVNETTQGPPHPYDELPPWSRFKIWLNLFLTSHQVKEDVETLFRKLYADRVRFYFDSVPEFHDFVKRWKSHKLISTVKFSLWTGVDLLYEEPSNLLKDNEQLIKTQRGFKGEWLECPSFYRMEPERFTERFGPHGPSRDPRWIPESDGFAVTEYEHCRCQRDFGDMKGCNPFKRLDYPALENGCRLMSYTWFVKKRPVGGVMVLEGRMGQIEFGGINMTSARAHLRQNQKARELYRLEIISLLRDGF